MTKSLFEKFTLLLNALGAIGILLMVLFINLDVFSRTFFNAPLAGVTEFIGLAIVAIVWLQAANTLRTDRFIKSDVFSSMLEKRLPRFSLIVKAAFNLVGGAICLTILNFSIEPAIKAFERGYYKGTFGVFTIPVWPVKIIIIIGCVTLAVQFLLLAWHDIRAAFNPSKSTVQQ
ncbi:TRAP transporter small permease (plasmid) [Leisingera sp. M527]|uniref:TRAP transporter small permease subunit n=1 Tax=Leisingera sp. M527 TaxID=2867014 RepID=UPI0021A389D3|nr:TRAP transporter small permease [Leisingera sp. M527]UWQ35448.1 TRAP transporter small permease [Leisingera sp. M527]